MDSMDSETSLAVEADSDVPAVGLKEDEADMLL